MTSLDLCRTTSEGTEWAGTFVDLDVAKAKLLELAETARGDYSILINRRESGFSIKTILSANGYPQPREFSVHPLVTG
jgi:hypothetical protein